MKSSDELFQLIRSMSKSERGYFIKYSKVHVKGEQNNYMRLFEVMAEMNEYSDEYLKKKLKFEPVLKYLSTAKNQLHGIILKTMRPYYEEYSTRARLGDLNNDVEFLHSKSLKAQSLKLNNRLKQGSVTNEKPLLLIEALNRDYKLLLAEMENAGERDVFLEKTWNEQKKAMKILGNTLEMEYYKQRIMSFSNKKGFIRNTNDHKNLNEILRDPVLSDSKNCLSSDALINWYLLQSRALILTGEYEKAARYLRKLFALFEEQATLVTNHPSRFLHLIEEFIFTSVKTGKFKDALNLNGKLKRLPEHYAQFRTDYFRSLIFMKFLGNEILILLQSGEVEKAIEQLDFCQEELKKHLSSLDVQSRMLFFLRISILYFHKGEFRKALQYLQEILCTGYEKQNSDMESFVKIYNLLIHFELDNKDHLFYAIKSASRGLIRKERMHAFETVVLAFLRNSINKGKRMQSCELALQQLCFELQIIKEDQYGARAFEHFDFLDWAVKKHAAMMAGNDKSRAVKRNLLNKELRVTGRI